MLLNTDNLKSWLGYDQEARVIAWLNEHGVKWWPGKGGHPCTTEAQIDASFNDQHQEVEFEDGR